MSVVGELLVNLRASTAAFAKDLDKASQLSFNTAKEIERSWKIIGGVAAGAFTAAAVAVTGLVEHSISAAAEMNRLSAATGVDVERFTALAYAARITGADTGQLSKALVTLSKNLEKSSQETAEGKAAHSALGTLFRGNIPVFKSTEEAFLAIADRLARLSNTTERTALGTQILGKAWLGVAPLMVEGAKRIAELEKEAAQLGVTIDKETAESAEKFEQDIKKLKFAVEGLGNEITKKLLPALTAMSEAAVGLVKSDHKLRELFEALTRLTSGGFGSVETQMKRLAAEGKLLADKLQIDKDNAAAVAAAMETAAKAHEKMEQAVRSVNEKLTEQIATVGQTKFQVEEYRLAVLGATAQEIKHLQSLHTKAEGLAQLNKPLKDIIKLHEETVQSIQEQIRITDELQKKEREQAAARLGELLGQSSALQAVLDQGIGGAGKLAEALKKPAQPLTELGIAAQTFGARMGQALEHGILEGGKFSDVLQSILLDLEKAILKLLVIDPLIKALGGKGAGGFGGFLASILGGFGGFLAGGGSTSASKGYIVGENGPEFFYPGVTGTVVPNGGGNVTNNYIDARGADATVIEMKVRRAIAKSQKESVAMSVASVREMSLRTT